MLFTHNFRCTKHTVAKVIREIYPEVGVWDGEQRGAGRRKLAVCRSGVGVALCTNGRYILRESGPTWLKWRAQGIGRKEVNLDSLNGSDYRVS